MKRMGDEAFYTFSSSLLGEVQGTIQLMMRSIDFDYMGELMQPVLSLLFLSDPDTDLETLNSKRPDWMENGEITTRKIPNFTNSALMRWLKWVMC